MADYMKCIPLFVEISKKKLTFMQQHSTAFMAGGGKGGLKVPKLCKMGFTLTSSVCQVNTATTAKACLFSFHKVNVLNRAFNEFISIACVH